MNRALIIPAAGRGSRLQSEIPKVLYPIAGRPMLDRLLELYAGVVERFVLVVSPEFNGLVRGHCASSAFAGRIAYAIQERPDGMLPAILTAAPVIAQWQPESVWITWCDQVAIRSGTVRRLIELTGELTGGDPDLVFPTVRKHTPYIHFDRDAAGRIAAVRHRREGDAMPQTGESDSGLFALSRRAFLEHLPRFAAEPERGAATGERNFLPFIPWIAQRGTVLTYDVEAEVESLGVNTASDARQIEDYFAARS
jgi:bifunctional UDP-N-acetylglucosamine pyrophosphorylase/glucosamine-1-phosphate N-acetyltransferase